METSPPDPPNCPADFHPDLTDERLRVLGKLIFESHNSAVDVEDVEEGDGPWSTGCRAYERVLARVERLTHTTDWLTMRMEGSLAFFVIVGTCPMRIRRPDQQRGSTYAELSASTEMQTLLPLFGQAEMGATLRLQKVLEPPRVRVKQTRSAGEPPRRVIEPSRRVTEILLSVVSADDAVVYHTWQIFVPSDAEVLPTLPPQPAYTIQRLPLGPRGVGRGNSDIEDV